MKPLKTFPAYPPGSSGPVLDMRLSHIEDTATATIEIVADHETRLQALEKPHSSPLAAIEKLQVPWLKLAGMAILGLLAATGHVSPEVIKKIALGGH
jgi:hypothetical protein